MKDVEAFVLAYVKYFEEQSVGLAGSSVQMVDPAPRVILDPVHGCMMTSGRTVKDCSIASEIYQHTMEIQANAEALGGWRALPKDRLFQVEYWDLEQAKLGLAGKAAAFTGEIALVTGSAGGIGKACVEALLARGAAVIGLDKAEQPASGNGQFVPIKCDLADDGELARAFEIGVQTFGGLDMLVLNAGIFPPAKPLAQMDVSTWQLVQNINVTVNVALARLAHPMLARAPRGGRVVLVGSKNVAAPGPGAGAYSASKAALTQLARVAALEWGGDGIRVNVIHPNAVFDTGIWNGGVLEARAASYGMSVEAYKKNNILGVEISSRDVAELAAEMCGVVFSKTTGAQIPIDGGNDRVI